MKQVKMMELVYKCQPDCCTVARRLYLQLNIVAKLMSIQESIIDFECHAFRIKRVDYFLMKLEAKYVYCVKVFCMQNKYIYKLL